jgi:Na+/melibiose symporter-like transporter
LDEEDIRYLNRIKNRELDDTQEIDRDNKEKNFWRLLKFKGSIILSTLTRGDIAKFYLFLILKGLCAPAFNEFRFYFANSVLEIKAEILTSSTLVGGVLAILGPPIYFRILAKMDFRTIYLVIQIIFVIQSLLTVAMAMLLHQKLGIPNLLMYLIAAPLADFLESVMIFLPSTILIAKMLEPGIEGTMMAISGTIFSLNRAGLPSVVGVLINTLFVHVTN